MSPFWRRDVFTLFTSLQNINVTVLFIIRVQLLANIWSALINSSDYSPAIEYVSKEYKMSELIEERDKILFHKIMNDPDHALYDLLPEKRHRVLRERGLAQTSKYGMSINWIQWTYSHMSNGHFICPLDICFSIGHVYVTKSRQWLFNFIPLVYSRLYLIYFLHVCNRNLQSFCFNSNLRKFFFRTLFYSSRFTIY